MTSGKKDQGGGGRASLTPQRRAVLQVVSESAEHLTAGEIYEAARRVLPTISFATVYNSLKYLKEAGLLGEISFGKASSRYDRETPRLARAAARRSRFKAVSVHLTLVGVCPDCQKKG